MASSKPPGPTLDTRITDEDSFHRYLELFNRPDYEGFTAYYTEDVVFGLGPGQPMVGRQAIIATYKEHYAHLKEHCGLRWLLVGTDAVAAELDIEFDCFEDWPEFPGGPLRAGDVRRGVTWVHYDLRDGRISEVRVNLKM